MATRKAKPVQAAEVDVTSEAKVSNLYVTVTWSGGERVYSNEIHGVKFAELAAEFAKKHGGTIR